MPYVELEQVIIGTAGHIDHGKTALVKALTGIDTDTLAEEKKRGITIELGFAFMDVPGFDRQIIFIDVPGHERLIKTMVAGASNLDAALLVIAADEGINVQTLEHFDILRLFGLQTGVIALTKADLVDDQRIKSVISDVKELVGGSFLEDAPVIPCSAVTGQGISEVRTALLDTANKVKARRDTGIFRMPIDRVFTIQGFGTVVAGTILSGEVKVGDRLEVLPDRLQSRVRGVQVHNEAIQRSYIGRRTAINLQDIKKEQLRRGQTLCAIGTIEPSNRLDARLHILNGYDSELKNRERIRLHVGADEVIGRVVLLDADRLEPGQTGLVQFALESQAVTLPKDRFVIRTFSTLRTIGGGIILDGHPALHKRFDKSVLNSLKSLEGEAYDAIEQVFINNRYIPKTAAEVAAAVGEGEEEVLGAIRKLYEEGRLFKVYSGNMDKVVLDVRDKFIHKSSYYELVEKLESIINDYYLREPYRLLMPLPDLISKFVKLADRQVFDTIFTDLIAKGRLIKRENRAGIAGRKPPFKPEEEQTSKKIVKLFYEAGYATPLEEDAADELNLDFRVFNSIITSLLDEGTLVRLNDKVIYHKEHMEKARQLVIEHIKANRSITAAELRDKLGVTRKYSIAILEYLDSIFLTRRDGDRRVLK